MKLSEAIREGAKKHPQCFGRYAGWLDDGRVGTCALGAAYTALAGRRPQVECRSERVYDYLCKRMPEYRDYLQEHWTQICSWNDTKRLSREEIADRVEAAGL